MDKLIFIKNDNTNVFKSAFFNQVDHANFYVSRSYSCKWQSLKDLYFTINNSIYKRVD